MQLARHWRQRAARYRLEGIRNRNNGEICFPPEEEQGDEWEAYTLSGQGEVYSFTQVRQPPEGYDEQPPYLLALVKLAEGPLITAQLTDCALEAVSIGMPVEMVTRKLCDLGQDGIIVYGPKFRPLVM